MEKLTECAGGAVFVFDSGIGGLNLLCECALRVSGVRYYYVSDNANVPYGNKSADEIYRLTLQALDGIQKYNPAALVVACNTVTARCIDRLREKYGFPVIGIQPAVKQAAAVGGRCLVLATEATVESKAFSSLLSRFGDTEFVVDGCKDLARYIESNIFNLPQKLPSGLLPDEKVDSVVLGCTHYVYIERQIAEHYSCPVFDGIAGTADHFAEILGIVDHFDTFSGKTDHCALKQLKINFLVGDMVKNKQIFKKLLASKFQ